MKPHWLLLTLAAGGLVGTGIAVLAPDWASLSASVALDEENWPQIASVLTNPGALLGFVVSVGSTLYALRSNPDRFTSKKIR